MRTFMPLLAALALILGSAQAADYPAPKPAQDTSQYGKHFQRTMTLMATSTPQRRHTVRILFYGQSIIGQGWHTMVVEDLQRCFPNTDFIVANKALGGFGSHFLVRTLHYDVIPFYPDLMVFHVYGPVDKYEEVIREIRSRTTAEIIMQSDHAHVWPEGTRDSPTPFADIARKYGCSWQPQRWEWVDYLRDNELEPADLLRDEVHLNEHGRWLMAELLKRYMIYLPDEPQDEWKDTVRTYEVGEDIHWHDGRLSLTFTGNRVVALAAPGPGGVAASVRIDGTAPSAHPECYTFTRPSGTPTIGWPAIKKVTWRKPPVLESWEATCRDFNEDQTEFAFSVEGSETDFDGTGTASETFVSNSGRIVIEPEDWVFDYDRRVGKKPAPDGFKVRWHVELLGTDTYEAPEVTDPAREHSTVLASDLENTQHTLELVAENGRPPALKALVVYRPSIGR